MNYMLLIYNDPQSGVGLTDAEQGAIMGEYFAFTQAIVDSGEMVAGDPLQGVETATTVTLAAGAPVVTDGPFAETKEVLGGYYIVNVDSRERAEQLAAQIPAARHGKVEVRPVMSMSMDGAPA